jgi:hypothetical protein
MKENFAEVIRASMQNAVSKLHLNQRGSCLVDECAGNALAKGLCNAHYLRSRKGRDMSLPVQAKTDACIDCGSTLNSKGGWMRCSKHFKLARQNTIKEALVDAMGGCCQNCYGIFALSAYDFHHVGKKDNDPSYMIGNASVERIAKEIEECVLLCANCHRIEHASKF